MSDGPCTGTLDAATRLASSRDADELLALGDACHRREEDEQALRCYERALELRPTSAAIARCYCETAHGLGRIDEAVRRCEALVQAHFLDPGVRAALGLAYLRAGRPEQALAQLERVVQDCVPNRLEVLDDAVSAAIASAQPGRGAALCGVWLEHEADNARAFARLGHCRHLGGDVEGAIAALHLALELEPDSRAHHVNLGTAYGDLGDFEQAERHFEAALLARPGDADALAGLASLAERRGEASRAIDLLSPALLDGRAKANVAVVFANAHLSLGRAADAVPVVERALSAGGHGRLEREALHFCLARLLDDLDRWGPAFEHARAGNALHVGNFDAARFEQSIAQLMAIFPARERVPCHEGGAGAQLIFIVGMPRSGTTLLERHLAQHPRIHGAGELDCIDRLINSLPARIHGAGQAGYAECIDGLTPEILHELRDAYAAVARDGADAGCFVIDKMPQNFMHLGFIAALFPDAHVLHCVRDPLDTCLSCYFQRFSAGHEYAYDLTSLGHYYAGYARLMAHWKEALPIRMLDVPYEDVVRDARHTIGAALAFCGIDWHEDCDEFKGAAGQMGTASYQQIRRPVYSSSVGRARSYLPHAPELVALASTLTDLDRTREV